MPVTTLAGGSEAGTADGAGAAAHFKHPCRLRLNERGCLFVTEYDSEDTLRERDVVVYWYLIQ